MAAVLSIRQGRVMAMETHELEGVAGLDAAACLGAFLPHTTPTSPRFLAVLVSDDIEDREVFEEFLAEQRGGPVEVHVPKRGDARRLIAQAAETALVALRQQRIVDDYDAPRPRRCSMISQPVCSSPHRRGGSSATTSATRWGRTPSGRWWSSRTEDRRPRATVISGSRPSRVPTTSRPSRRPCVAASGGSALVTMGRKRTCRCSIRRGPTHQRAAATDPACGDDVDLSFSVLPDLILIDGGKGQLSAAVKALREAG